MLATTFPPRRPPAPWLPGGGAHLLPAPEGLHPPPVSPTVAAAVFHSPCTARVGTAALRLQHKQVMVRNSKETKSFTGNQRKIYQLSLQGFLPFPFPSHIYCHLALSFKRLYAVGMVSLSPVVPQDINRCINHRNVIHGHISTTGSAAHQPEGY